MILVDSSVWIDYFRGAATPACEQLDQLLSGVVLLGDLILAEVLQGYNSEREYQLALRRLSSLPCITLGGRAVAVQSAVNYRKLRSLGISIRKTIDTIIATACIMNGFELLHSDRDFDPFVRHLGLQSVL